MRVLISGAGIAGNALAFWLSKLNHDVVVVERFANLRVTGLQIDLRGHGITVLRRMGLEENFRSRSAPEQGFQVVDKSGRRRAYFPANKSGKGAQSFTTDYEIMRGDFCQLLYHAAKPRAKFVFGTSVESFEEKDDGGVEVKFVDGTIEKFDLLVGADGQGSHTRKMIFESESTGNNGFYPLHGFHVAYFTIPRPIQEGEEYIATMYMAPGRRGVMTRRSNQDEIQVYLGYASDAEKLKATPGGNGKVEKEALAEIFKGAGWKIDEILESVKDSKNFYCEGLGIVKLDHWSRGCVALLGDAAYCPSANTGMGTTSAIVGAYILAGEIGKSCGDSNINVKDGLTTALKAYEQKFQPFMAQIQKGLLEDKESKIWSTAFGIEVLNYLLGVAAFFKVNIGKWMLKENVKGWDLPEYAELLRD